MPATGTWPVSLPPPLPPSLPPSRPPAKRAKAPTDAVAKTLVAAWASGGVRPGRM